MVGKLPKVRDKFYANSAIVNSVFPLKS